MVKTSTTLILAIVAAVLCTAAILAVPPEISPEVFSDQGEVFFPDLADPNAAKEIEVVEPEPDGGSVKLFNIKFEDGLWRIPSEHGYPADATERMANAAASLIGLRKDKVVSNAIQDQTSTATEDPTDAAASIGGRGKLIRLKDMSGRSLAELIVGDPVEGKPGWAYVRLPGKKRIYAVDLERSEEGTGGELLTDISTEFKDWIDTDLLRVERNDIEKITLYDYSVNEETRRVEKGDEITLVQGDNQKWDMPGFKSEEEEVNDAAVRDLVSTLDTLKIAGVRPSPEPLNAISLASAGFFFDGQNNFYGNEGHMDVASSDGVIYALYFGEIVYGGSEAPETGDEPAERGEDRYLFVDVRLDPEIEKKPDEVAWLESLPAEDAAATGAETGAEAKDETAAPDQAAAEGEGEQPGADQTARKEAAEKARKEWAGKIEKAREKLAELELRFDKWYYVISGGSFDKLSATRSDLVQPKLPDVAGIGEQPPEGREPIKEASGLAYYQLEWGSGKPAAKGDVIKVIYTGWLKDGTEFDRADDKAAPFTFTLGEGSVIKGWDEGLVGMRAGGRRKLIIPPEMGYGAKGAGEKIPPDAVLIFDVDLIEIEGQDDH